MKKNKQRRWIRPSIWRFVHDAGRAMRENKRFDGLSNFLLHEIQELTVAARDASRVEIGL